MSHTANSQRGPGAAEAKTRIGFIGLGAMGSRIAGRLLDAGHPVYATNRTAAKARPLIERGLAWLGSAREVAASTDVVLSMVTDDEALEAIATGPQGMLAGLGAGQVYVDMSTVSPQASRRLAERVRALGAHMLDAPVSGSIPQAESGTLAIMVGGEREAFAAVEPLLRELGQTVTHVGPNGQGLVLKLAINISLAVQTLAFSEGLLLAERAGVDPDVAAEVMSTSSIGSPMLKARTPLLLHLPDHAWFDVELMQKDIGLARQTAADLHIPLPSATVADHVLTEARHLGYAHRDLAALHDVLAQTITGSVGSEPAAGHAAAPRTRAVQPNPAKHGAPAASNLLSRRTNSLGDSGEARHA
jgi:3-hydroxyisobutyrate dehydrogenase-like beta-hydroxyacid dehydrogenase